MLVDLFARDPIRFVLVDLGVQEPGVADHAPGVERHLESEGQLEFPCREVAGPPAQDLPEVVPAQVPGPPLVRARPGEHTRIGRRRVDLEHVEGQVDAFHRGDPGRLSQVVRFHDPALHPALNHPDRAVAVDLRREHGMPQDERLVPLEPGHGAAVRTRDDHLARGQGQGSAALGAVDGFDELGHADGMLMGWSNIASFMGSLGALRRGSLLTVVLLFAFLSLLLLLIVAIVDYVFQAHAFPGGFAIVVALSLSFILLEWLISPFIVRWAIRSREPVTPESNPWLYQTIQELTRQAGVPMPRVWVSQDSSPNAFVFGRTVSSSELVVTQALLQQLNQDEIRAVLAHEIGHLRHRDVVIVTLMSAIPLIAYVIARFGFEMMRSGVRTRGKGGGQAVLAIILSAGAPYPVLPGPPKPLLYPSGAPEE